MRYWNSLKKYMKKHIVMVSIIITMLLSLFASTQLNYFFWLPDFLAMMLWFWILNNFSSIRLRTIFFVGLVMDILSNTYLGLHPIFYIVVVYWAVLKRQRLAVYDYGIQSMAIGLSLLAGKIVMTILLLLSGRPFVGWKFFISVITSALLWSMLNKLMYSKFYTKS